MILFRGKKEDCKWIEGDLLQGENCYISTKDEFYNAVVSLDGHLSTTVYKVDPKTVSQYIGINDKNDIKMFSGDKFRVHSKNNENWHIDKIVRINPNSLTLEVANLDELKNEDMDQIWQRPQEYWWEDRVGRIEIIGNIYDKDQS